MVKPAIGASARMTVHTGRLAADEAQQHLDRLLDGEDAVIQPYLPSIADHGELSVVVIDGEPTHAVAKRPTPGDWRVQRELGGTVDLIPMTAGLVTAAMATITALDSTPTYARVDLVRADDGQLAVDRGRAHRARAVVRPGPRRRHPSGRRRLTPMSVAVVAFLRRFAEVDREESEPIGGRSNSARRPTSRSADGSTDRRTAPSAPMAHPQMHATHNPPLTHPPRPRHQRGHVNHHLSRPHLRPGVGPHRRARPRRLRQSSLLAALARTDVAMYEQVTTVDLDDPDAVLGAVEAIQDWRRDVAGGNGPISFGPRTSAHAKVHAVDPTQLPQAA